MAMGYLANWVLNQQAKRVKRKVGFKNLKTCDTCLIIYNCSSESQEEEARNLARYFKEERIKPETIGFFDKRGKSIERPKDQIKYFYYDRKEINWWGFPKRRTIKRMLRTDYDLLIDLNKEADHSLQVLLQLSKAKFKVGGNTNYSDSYDLHIAVPPNKSGYLIDQIKIYLNMLNP